MYCLRDDVEKQKAKALCGHVLAPDSAKTHVDEFKEKDLPFSVVTDASNEGMCAPIVLRYFHLIFTRYFHTAYGVAVESTC